MMRQEYKPYAGWHQVHLKDETSTDDLSNAWTPDAIARELAVGDRSIGIGTYRDTTVPFTVVVYDAEPEQPKVDEWDRVNDTRICVQSGKLVLWGCGEYWPNAPRISVEPGWYHVRVCYGGRDTLSDDGVDGDDHYEISLWPAGAVPCQRINGLGKC